MQQLSLRHPLPGHSAHASDSSGEPGSPVTGGERAPLLVEAAKGHGIHAPEAKVAGPGVLQSVWAAAVSYILASSSLLLMNKYLLSAFAVRAPNTILLYHCSLAVAALQGLRALGVVQLEPLRWRLAAAWFPANLLFVGMIVTSFYALQSLGVGVFTVLKNASNVSTILGDYIFFRRTYTWHVWACLGLLLLSVMGASSADAASSWSAYGWMGLNCVLTSGYSLFLSGLVGRAKDFTAGGQRMSELSMVLYNNLLSVPLLFVLAVAAGELPAVLRNPYFWEPRFQAASALGGALGFGISFASLWFISISSATFVCLAGSMNKVIVAAAGITAFGEPATARSFASISLGVMAGIALGFARQRH